MDSLKGQRLHFLGIAGHTMRGLALAARDLGAEVSGTDPGAKPPGSTWLNKHKFRWWSEADPAHLNGVTKVIISSGTKPEDTEVQAAQAQDIPIQSFAAFVGELTEAARRVVISGTHGKTTTTSLLAWIFECAGRKPDYLIGMKPHNFESSVRLNGADIAIIEGDEYRSSQLEDTSKFMHYHPDVLVITSVELDHPDFFSNLDEIERRFIELVKDLPPEGRVYYTYSGSLAAKAAGEQRIPYGAHPTDPGILGWHCGKRMVYGRNGLRFSVIREDYDYGVVEVPLYGRHNAENALAAAAVSLDENVPFEVVKEALRTFKGASRRFERVTPDGASVTVIDDYAHHPTEVKATIAAAKRHFKGRVLAMFQPHTYSRTRELLSEYGDAFTQADRTVLLEIEGAREADLEDTISSQDIADLAGDTVAVYERDAGLQVLATEAHPGDVILSMSVGGAGDFAQELAERVTEPSA